MFLRTDLTNRRTFLERSALGAGSMLFLPELLTSCTDHRIPDPGMPDVTPPILVDDDEDSDWLDDTKTIVITALDAIPEVGEILGALAEILWPKGESAWDQVKAKVEQLVQSKIDEAVYSLAQDKLKGLQILVTCYSNAIKDKDIDSIKTKWIDVSLSFAEALPQFQYKDENDKAVMMLPLFAQFANMHLAVLRDGVIGGKDWGLNAAEQQRNIDNLKSTIQDFTDYALLMYNARLGLLRLIPVVGDDCAPFIFVNSFRRGMTLTVLDFVPTWAYYDVSDPKNQNGAKVPPLTREIYSDPYGTCRESGNIVLPTQPPTQGPSQIIVNRVAGTPIFRTVRLTYPAGSGPDGVTQTPERGSGPQAVRTDLTYTDSVTTVSPTNPITKARVFAYVDRYQPAPSFPTLFKKEGVEAMMFEFKDKTRTGMIGGLTGDGLDKDSGWISFPYHTLSSIWVNGGVNVDEGPYRNYGAADSVVFGFLYANGAPPKTTNMMRLLYITSPKERSATEFAQAYSRHGVTQALITEEVKAARQAHWDSIKSRAVC